MPTPRDTPVPRLLTIVCLLGVLGCPVEEVPADGETGGSELLPGTLVITEVVANVPGTDEGLEWFEIHNASSEAVDLEGLVLVYETVDGTGRKTHTVARSVEVPAGGYVVVGSLLDELAGAGHVDYGYANELGDFGNSAGYLAIESQSQDIVDEAYYQNPSEKASRTFDGSQAPDAIANDNLDNWCDSRSELDPEFAATPGAANDVCGGATTCLQDGQPVAIVHPLPGEIVITEVLPNPDFVGDDIGEWFELQSLASADFHLNGLEIGKSLEDAAEDTIASPECITLAAGQHAVVAKSADPTVNGEVPAEVIVWETDISLTNTDGSLWVGVAGEVLDVVTWGSAGAGEATQLDPDFIDSGLNDDLSNWCDATEPFNAGDVGTPGAANSQCFIAPPDGQCYENGQLRDIVQIGMGDLEITELLPNPEAVADTAGEWFEVRIKSDGDLNGLQIGKAGTVDEDVVEFGDAPGFASDACIAVTAGDIVVFARSDDPLVNGGLPQVDVLFDMSLNNSNSDLTIGYGGVVWDTATWTSSTAGASLAKDALGTWCDGVDPYGDGDLGTPGGANPMCEGGPMQGCIDPDTMLMRMPVPPTMADITITEVMPDPLGAPDATGEWFELHANGAFDLNGVQLGKNGVVSHTFGSDMCLEVAANSYVVFGRSDVDLENCTLPVDYVYAGLSLTNDNGNLQVGHGDVVLVETSWVGSNAGAALSFDGMTWCDAVEAFGCGDHGTPRVANPACGGGGGDGQCFDGQAMMQRDIVLAGPGDLVISEFMANPNAVGDTAGEWFELHALSAVDLNGLELGQLFADGPLHTVTSNDCIVLQPGDNVLLARNGDGMLNGGLPPVDYVFAGFGLSNTNTGLHIAVGGQLIDEIGWAAVGTGCSTSLDPDSLDPALNDLANNAAPWCYTPAVAMFQFGGGDYGTPGEDNLQCP
jgi:hypothetical protein